MTGKPTFDVASLLGQMVASKLKAPAPAEATPADAPDPNRYPPAPSAHEMATIWSGASTKEPGVVDGSHRLTSNRSEFLAHEVATEVATCGEPIWTRVSLGLPRAALAFLASRFAPETEEPAPVAGVQDEAMSTKMLVAVSALRVVAYAARGIDELRKVAHDALEQLGLQTNEKRPMDGGLVQPEASACTPSSNDDREFPGHIVGLPIDLNNALLVDAQSSIYVVDILPSTTHALIVCKNNSVARQRDVLRDARNRWWMVDRVVHKDVGCDVHVHQLGNYDPHRPEPIGNTLWLYTPSKSYAFMINGTPQSITIDGNTIRYMPSDDTADLFIVGSEENNLLGIEQLPLSVLPVIATLIRAAVTAERKKILAGLVTG
jgi:hypothetical protein